MEHSNGAKTPIKCEVTNCRYHAKDTLCTADAIEVCTKGAGSQANSSSATCCATFENKMQ